MLTYISTIAGVAAAEPKTKSAATPANTSIKLYNPVMRLCNHFVTK